MNSFRNDPQSRTRSGPRRAPVRIGPLFLTTAFLCLATLTFLTIRGARDSAVSAPQLQGPPTVRSMPALRRSFVPPLEPSPGPPVAAPELPGETASKAELWTYGTRYLGWQAIEEVELGAYSEAELRSWLEEDQRLYVRVEQPAGEPHELSVVGNQE